MFGCRLLLHYIKDFKKMKSIFYAQFTEHISYSEFLDD